jgi:phosphotransferase system enzyme I (PtsP)
MAEPVNAQARLDKIVTVIASNMVAEVCSFYVMRADNTLELFATEGLKREAVHLTTMKAGEGLVGLIAQQAEPLNLPNAQSHPSFSYKPVQDVADSCRTGAATNIIYGLALG